jgi:hypothetical protein
LLKELRAAVQGSGRLDLTGIEVQFKRKRAGKSKVNHLLQKYRKNLFRTLSRA